MIGRKYDAKKLYLGITDSNYFQILPCLLVLCLLIENFTIYPHVLELDMDTRIYVSSSFLSSFLFRALYNTHSVVTYVQHN